MLHGNKFVPVVLFRVGIDGSWMLLTNNIYKGNDHIRQWYE